MTKPGPAMNETPPSPPPAASGNGLREIFAREHDCWTGHVQAMSEDRFVAVVESLHQASPAQADETRDRMGTGCTQHVEQSATAQAGSTPAGRNEAQADEGLGERVRELEGRLEYELSRESVGSTTWLSEQYRQGMEHAKARAAELEQYIQAIRPKADAYDRVCSVLGIDKDICGHVQSLKAQLAEARRERDELKAELAKLQDQAIHWL